MNGWTLEYQMWARREAREAFMGDVALILVIGLMSLAWSTFGGCR